MTRTEPAPTTHAPSPGAEPAEGLLGPGSPLDSLVFAGELALRALGRKYDHAVPEYWREIAAGVRLCGADPVDIEAYFALKAALADARGAAESDEHADVCTARYRCPACQYEGGLAGHPDGCNSFLEPLDDLEFTARCVERCDGPDSSVCSLSDCVCFVRQHGSCPHCGGPADLVALAVPA